MALERTISQFDNLCDFMLQAAESAPDRPAVVEAAGKDDLVTVSYGELAAQVAYFAAVLDELALDVGDRVVLDSHNSATAIAMLLACCSQGLPFIPVCSETPTGRLLAIFDATDPSLYLRPEGQRRDGLPTLPAEGHFGKDGLVMLNRPARRKRHRRDVVGTDPAYIIFTSGSTGRPKGVVMSHRANIAFYCGLLRQGVVTGSDRVAVCAPFHFDLCLGGIGLALGSGGTVVPVPRDRLEWPRRFLGLLRDAKVTQVQGVPSVWRQVLRHESRKLAELGQLRSILFSGEEFPLPELRHLQRILPHVRTMNCYGATETMASSVTEVPSPLAEDQDRLSIGSAHPGAEMTLVDELGQPVVEPGVVGEIYLRGPTLFSGYWDDPDATRSVLVPDPLNPRSGQIVFRTSDLAEQGPDGELFFCGRADSQVQVRGNRVELGEVERRLCEFPGIAGAAALMRQEGMERTLNVCVVLHDGVAMLDMMELRAFCMKALPIYMVPKEIHVLDELPLTANGKIDRPALTAMLDVG